MPYLKKYDDKKIEQNIDYLELLARQFPTVEEASTEIINLQAILNLPKGTEHFLSDIHGEYEAFSHVLRNGSGTIKRKIEEVFDGKLRQSEKQSLATLIYYPEEILNKISEKENDMNDWYDITLHRLVHVCRAVSSKYTRSKVRKALPKDFVYIIEELLHEKEEEANKQKYYDGIIKTIIQLDRSDSFIIALCNVIQKLAVDRLHIIGDIYDRGPGPHIIMDMLHKHHSVDIQWGNHDIIWMGAAAGSEVCISNVIRICARYANTNILEEGYGINLLPLATFALEVYNNDPCEIFYPKLTDEQKERFNEKEIMLIQKMHKAISVIQFKLEGEVIDRNSNFGCSHRKVLDHINFEEGTYTLDNKTYEMNDTHFPTIDNNNPYELTDDEKEVIRRFKFSFHNNDKLQKHVRTLLSKGSIYLKHNDNLLFHGCIPMTKNGEFAAINIEGKSYRGKGLMDKLERVVIEAYNNRSLKKDENLERDYYWYLWTGINSPLFGKKEMKTFERYFIDNKESQVEEYNTYYNLREQEEVCIKILEEFNIDVEKGRIINGHVPVKVKKGENPIKASGKLLVIDGGFSKAYQQQTGIAGYTLIYNSYGLLLAVHEPFLSRKQAIEEEIDILSTLSVVEFNRERRRVKDTDIGLTLESDIEKLEMLLSAYRKGLIKEDKKI